MEDETTAQTAEQRRREHKQRIDAIRRGGLRRGSGDTRRGVQLAFVLLPSLLTFAMGGVAALPFGLFVSAVFALAFWRSARRRAADERARDGRPPPIG